MPINNYITLPELSASAGASLMGYNQGSTGAATITQQAKNQQIVNVLDFYANGVSGVLVDPTGTVDSTIGIQDAINTGARVWIPPGTYLHSGLTWASAGQFLGSGENVTYLQCAGTNVNSLTIGNGTNNPNDVLISDMTLTYTAAQTTSAAITVSNSHNIKLERLRFTTNIFDAIHLNGGAQQYMYFLRQLEVDGVAGSGIVIGFDGTLAQDIWISDSEIAGAAMYGIDLLNVSGFYIKDVDCLGAGLNGIRTYPNTGKEVVAGIFNNVLADTCGDWGWNLIDNGGTVSELSLNACWASSCGTSTNAGGLITNSGLGNPRALQITSGSYTNNKGPGLKFLSGTNIDLVNVQSFCNSTHGSGLYSGIEFGAGVTNFSVIGGSAGNGGYFAGTNYQNYGISVDAGSSSSYRLIGVDVNGNVTSGIFDGGTSGIKTIYACPGYITSTSGALEVVSGNSSAVVAHGLGITPNQTDIIVCPTVNILSGGITTYWISAVTATTFTISLNTTTSANLFFAWQARTKGA